MSGDPVADQKKWQLDHDPNRQKPEVVGYGANLGTSGTLADGPTYTPSHDGFMDYGDRNMPRDRAGREAALTAEYGTDWNKPTQWGGRYGLANNVASQYGQQAHEYGERRIGNTLSDPYRAQQGQTRGMQADALSGQRDAAMGMAPSASVYAQSLGLNRGLEAQFAAAHSGGPPTSSLGAMRAGAPAQLSTLMQSAADRSGEINASNVGWLQQGSAMRGADQRGFNIDQARELKQAELNQSMQLGSEEMANQILLSQLGADAHQYASRFGYNTQSELNAANRSFAAQQRAIGAASSGLSGALNAYASSSKNDTPSPGAGNWGSENDGLYAGEYGSQ